MPSIFHLSDPALGAVENMARDEALLRSIGPNQAPILRTYTWQPAALSLGYFQDAAEASQQPPHIHNLPLVRRTTGGGAILHDLELTYSLTLPVDHPLVAGRPNCLYDAVHRAIAAAVRDTLAISARVDLHASISAEPAAPGACGSAQRGPFFCFARRHAYDVVVLRPDGTSAKLAGSAQRRGRVAMLQHGSIMLDTRYSEQPCDTWSACANRSIDAGEAMECLVASLSRVLDATIEPMSWPDEWQGEIERGRVLHGSAEWLSNRVRPAGDERLHAVNS